MTFFWGNKRCTQLAFGHDSWTKEAWFRPGWSLGDGHKESLLVSFNNLAGLVDSEAVMYGCVGLADTLPIRNLLLEGNMSVLDTAPPSELKVPGRNESTWEAPQGHIETMGVFQKTDPTMSRVGEGVDQGLLERQWRSTTLTTNGEPAP